MNGGATWSSAWSAIGAGQFRSAPAAAVSADGQRLHVFGLGEDDHFWRAFSSNGGATWDLAWAQMPDGVFTSAPAVVCDSTGQKVHVFGRGSDNRIWHGYTLNGGASWVAWIPIGEGVFSSGPAAALSADGSKLHVFGRGIPSPPPPPGVFPDPSDPRVWRAFSPDGGLTWTLAWDQIVPLSEEIVH